MSNPPPPNWTLSCPKCGGKFGVQNEMLGKHVSCPRCQATVATPTLEQLQASLSPQLNEPPLPESNRQKPAIPSAPTIADVSAKQQPVPPPTPNPQSKSTDSKTPPSETSRSTEPPIAKKSVAESEFTPKNSNRSGEHKQSESQSDSSEKKDLALKDSEPKEEPKSTSKVASGHSKTRSKSDKPSDQKARSKKKKRSSKPIEKSNNTISPAELLPPSSTTGAELPPEATTSQPRAETLSSVEKSGVNSAEDALLPPGVDAPKPEPMQQVPIPVATSDARTKDERESKPTTGVKLVETREPKNHKAGLARIRKHKRRTVRDLIAYTICVVVLAAISVALWLAFGGES